MYFKTMLLWVNVFMQIFTTNSLQLYLSKLIFCCKCLQKLGLSNITFCELLWSCYELLFRFMRMRMNNDEVIPIEFRLQFDNEMPTCTCTCDRLAHHAVVARLAPELFKSCTKTQHDLQLLIIPASTYLTSLQTMSALLAATWWRGQQQHWGMTNEQTTRRKLLDF